jgi:hypothetical protein
VASNNVDTHRKISRDFEVLLLAGLQSCQRRRLPNLIHKDAKQHDCDLFLLNGKLVLDVKPEETHLGKLLNKTSLFDVEVIMTSESLRKLKKVGISAKRRCWGRCA